MSPVLEMPATVVDKKNKNKKNIWPFLIFILVTLGILGIFLYQGRITSTENTVSPLFISITSPLSVTYTEVLVSHGSTVEKGAILARFDISDYKSQLPNANVLVRNALPTAEQTEALLKEAQSAEADMVNRIAMARHEENAKHTLMEKLSIAHAKAQLHMRSIQGSDAERQKAQQAEQRAHAALQKAKHAHEEASRNRAAIEGVLHTIRAQRYAQGYGVPGTSAAIAVQSIADHLIAPEHGRIVGPVPIVGQILEKDALAFRLIPSKDIQFTTISRLYGHDAASLRINMPAFVRIGNAMLSGTISQIMQEGNERLVTLSVHTAGEDIAKLDEAITEGDTKVVFWPKAWTRKYVPDSILVLLSYL